MSFRITHFDMNGLTIDVPEFCERPTKRVEGRSFDARVGAHQDADKWNPCRLLRYPGHWADENRTEGGDEVAAVHSMTSSARVTVADGERWSPRHDERVVGVFASRLTVQQLN
jgi:hypothetical protein